MRAPLSAKRPHIFDASNQYYVGRSQNGFMFERIYSRSVDCPVCALEILTLCSGLKTVEGIDGTYVELCVSASFAALRLTQALESQEMKVGFKRKVAESPRRKAGEL